jgi:hypothetical protein
MIQLIINIILIVSTLIPIKKYTYHLYVLSLTVMHMLMYNDEITRISMCIQLINYIMLLYDDVY